jgi:hypothetical protein
MDGTTPAIGTFAATNAADIRPTVSGDFHFLDIDFISDYFGGLEPAVLGMCW